MRILHYDDLQTISHRAGATEHQHRNCEIVMILEGTATNTVNDSVRKVNVGDCFFINTNGVHSIVEETVNNYNHRDIYIHPQTLEKICLNCFDEDYYQYLISSEKEVDIPLDRDAFLFFSNKLADLEIQSRLNPSPEKKETLDKCVSVIISQLLMLPYENLRLRVNSQKVIWMTEFLKTVQYPSIFRAPVEEIIQSSGYSHAQFTRLFRSVSHITFKEYVTEIRINYAKLLLSSNPTIAIEDLAYEVGYSSTSYFIQCFKKHTGITPMKYKYLNRSK